jgi:hypothetical protein
MTSQEFEALGVWEIGRQEVVNAVYLDAQDVLKICSVGDDVADLAACALHREQICGLEVSQDLDEQFGRKIEKGALGGQMHGLR